jgi:excisionase family DNA binding protein
MSAAEPGDRGNATLRSSRLSEVISKHSAALSEDVGGSLSALRIPEVCRLTGFGRTTIYAAIKSGDLVARRYRRRTIVLEEDLQRFLRGLPTI